jgi:hypothetical protein
MSGYNNIDSKEEERKHRKLEATDIGVDAPRGCTNIPFLVVFAVFWAFMWYIAGSSYGSGNLNRLIYGVDYQGNVCSKGTPPAGISAGSWAEMSMLYYPVRFSPISGVFNVKDAMQTGVCVESCPGLVGDKVSVYGTLASVLMPTSILYPAQSNELPTQFPTSQQFNRCIPDFREYNCSSQKKAEDRKHCEENRGPAHKVFEKIAGLQNLSLRGYAELKSNWWIILVCAIICIIISFAWLFLLRRLVKPVVIITIVLVFILLVCIGAFLYHQSSAIKAKDPQADSSDYYFYGAIGVWVCAFLYLCIIAFLFKDIMVACDIIEEASKIPVQMPTMMAVPPVLVLFVLPFIFFWVFTGACIYTSAESRTFSVPTLTTSQQLSNVTTTQYESSNWRTYAQLYNFFMLLWTLGFIHAVGFLIIAMCAVFWYWSCPGDDKNPEHGVADALKLTLRNHLGTLALGSFIVAIIQIVRVTLALFEKRMRAVGNNADAVKFCLKCTQCCLAYFERFVRFINANAYIVTAMTGEPFLDAARHAFSLLVSNALSVGAVTIVGEYVMFVGKLLITATCTFIAYLICTGTAAGKEATGDSRAGFLFVMIAVIVTSYFIACIFINVFGVCIDTVLLSYCYDLDTNNGQDRPYFFPSDLAKHVEGAQQRMEAKKQQTQGDGRDYEKPLQ